MLYVLSLKKSISYSVSIVLFAILSSCIAFPQQSSTISSNEIVEKYKKWKIAVKKPKDATKVFAFFYNNPHWPLFDESVKKAEKNAKSVSKKTILKWFKRYSPKTKEGLELYIKCLLEENRAFARKYIKQTWVFQNLSPEFMERYKTEFSDYVSPIEDAKKTKRLIKDVKISQLSTLKSMVIDEISDYISDFLERYVASKSEGYSKEDLKDVEKKHAIVQGLIDRNQNKKAANILSISNDNEEKYATSFFNQRRHVSFNILRAGDPKLAYKVMAMYKIVSSKQDERIARAEWLLGYISLRFLNDLKKAEMHFKKAYDNSLNSIRISKNAFWLAEVYKRRNDIVLAIDWYKQASRYFSTFYGYLAEKKLNAISKVSQENDVTFTEEFQHEQNFSSGAAFTFYNRELVQVLLNVEDKSMRKYFYRQLIYEIDDPNEEMLLMDIAVDRDETSILISENSKRQRYFPNERAYKLLKDHNMKYMKKVNSDPCFESFAHAVIQRESNFNVFARSHAGAVGLMQIMPATARYEAKRMKFYIGGALTDPYRNITIGASILNRLLNKYNGNIIYVAAAYNFGENRLSRYLESIKKLGGLNALDLIELIPVKETRLYVKHVIRSFFTYQKKFGASNCYNCKAILNSE